MRTHIPVDTGRRSEVVLPRRGPAVRGIVGASPVLWVIALAAVILMAIAA